MANRFGGSILFASAALIALGSSGCGQAAPTASTEQALAGGQRVYLAIGDSIPFGDNPFLENTDLGGLDTDWAAPAQFHGYPQDVGAALGLPVVNAGCPGETSASFFDVTKPDNGCQKHKADYEQLAPQFGDGLHADYGTGSQIDYLVRFLITHRRTKLVTVDIGANDLLLVQTACGADTTCLLTKVPIAIAKAAKNLTAILATLRGVGYFGPIVVQNYYQTDYNDSTQTIAITGINAAYEPVAALFGARVAKVDAAIRDASAAYGGDPCKAGLLIPLGDGTCNMHPTDTGRALITNAILAEID